MSGIHAELVWGAYALLVKSAAARRGFPLRSHQALRDFAHGIGMEPGRILSPDQGDAWLRGSPLRRRSTTGSTREAPTRWPLPGSWRSTRRPLLGTVRS